MIVSEAGFILGEEMTRVQARIQSGSGRARDQWGFFDVHASLKQPRTLGDPFLATCLLPAMFYGEDLEVRAPVSPRLARSTDAIQDTFVNWYPGEMRRIRVTTPELLADPAAPASDTACFFSGGVDSWYSILKHRARLTTLVTVKGFDIPYSETKIWPRIVEVNRQAASSVGLKVWFVETNLRDCIDPGFQGPGRQFRGTVYGRCLHGGFLAAVGLLLQGHVNTMLVPSTFPGASLHPWGSHPSVDPLWSTERTQFVHDGCEASRVEKIGTLARTGTCLRHLRVCTTHIRGRYNCGRCEKCLRTLLGLHLFDASARAVTFPGVFAPKKALALQLMPAKRIWYEEMLAAAVAMNRPDVARVCRVLLGHEKEPWAVRTLRRWRRSLHKRTELLRTRVADAVQTRAGFRA